MPTEHAPDAEEKRRGHAAELKPKMADELGAQQRRRSMQNIMVNTGSMRRTGCLECKKKFVAGKGGGVGGGGGGGDVHSSTNVNATEILIFAAWL
jgi:hypothetical protein